MRPLSTLPLVFSLAVLLAVPAAFADTKPAVSRDVVGAVPAAERRAELLHMVRQDCGSCHGMTMKGGLGPALTPDAVQGKPADFLAATILHGRPGTAMPPWQRFLSADEAAWIVEQLRKGLPNGN